MSEPIPLKEVYTAVQMLDPKFLRSWTTTGELERAFRQGTSRNFLPKDILRKDGLELANKIQFLNVLGQPGAGKSTFLRRIGLETLLPANERKYRHEAIPVFVELKRFKAQTVNLGEILRREFASFGFPETFSHTALKEGKLLVLLDGLDEVPTDNLDAAIEDIRDFVNEHSSNRFITSCRTAFYQTWFTRFTDVALADFDDDQIQTFLRNWFRSPPDRERETAEKVWQMLDRWENAATLELARTPLLLTFICLFHDATLSLPANRSDLYEGALKILLEKWAAEKRIRNDPICQGLTTKWEILLLEQIAGPAFEEDKIFFAEKQLVSDINRFLCKDLNAPHLEGEQVLEAIELQQGLLVKRAHNIYSFSHLTLQEYLAAQYFLNTGKIEELVKEHFFDRRWREVFLLLVGIGRADTVLLHMATSIDESIKQNAKLFRLVHWVKNSYTAARFKDRVEERSAARRAAVLFLVRSLDPYLEYEKETKVYLENIWNFARQLDSGLNLNEAFVNLGPLASSKNTTVTRSFALDLVARLKRSALLKDHLLEKAERRIESLKYELTYDHYTPYECATFGSSDIKHVLLIAFGVPEDLRRWTNEETKALQPVFYGCNFLVECKEAALSVSASVWTAIAKRLLSTSPPAE